MSLDQRIPTVIQEDTATDFSSERARAQLKDENSSTSSSILTDSRRSVSPSLNDDLASGVSSNNWSSSRRSFESSSIITSSFRASFDDSYQLLGLNKLSLEKISPLGPNSIYELIADADSRKTVSSHPLYLSPRMSNEKTNPKIHINPPTVNDIPPIQLSKLQKISKDVFKDYLNEVEKEYVKYSSNKKLTHNVLNTFVQKQDNENNTNLELLETEPDKLDTIPGIYFSDDFNLDDPRVFKTVTEGESIDHLHHILQDKLSWYLDTVEIHLVNEISRSSNSFFDALNDLNDISDKNDDIIRLVKDLEEELSSLKKDKIEKKLELLSLTRKKDNVTKFQQILLQINKILQEADIAESLFLQGEYECCLNKVDYVELLIDGHSKMEDWPYPLSDVKSIPALSNLRELLCKLRSQTGESYSKLFVDFLLQDLRDHYENIDYGAVVNRLIESKEYVPKIKGDFRTQLNDYIIGLTRSQDISTAFKMYEEVFYNEIKNIIRTLLPSDDQTQQQDLSETRPASQNSSKTSGKKLGTFIRKLTPKEFEDLLVKIYATISEALRRVKVHQKLLLDLALKNIDESEQDKIMQLDITNSINSTINIVHVRMSKVLKTRDRLNSSLRLDYFLRFFLINSIFLMECESISGLTFDPLSEVINSQIRHFNQTFHTNNLTKLSTALEHEEWMPLIVSRDIQQSVNDIVDNKNLDAGQPWKKKLLLFCNQRSSTAGPDDVGTEGVLNDGEESSTHRRSIVVGDKTFVASSSLLTVVSIIKEYFILKTNFHHYTDLYESNLIEIFRYFNTRSIQSVRKNDGSLNRDRNLSILGESLDCLLEIIHYVRLDFDNLKYDEVYNGIITGFASSKSRIDSISMISE